MINWRPKDWERYRPELLEATEETHKIYEDGVEAGADAILLALKKQAVYHTPPETKISFPFDMIRTYRKGWVIFIDDTSKGQEEEKSNGIVRPI